MAESTTSQASGPTTTAVLFVYGTHMVGLGNQRLLGTSQFIGHARTRDDAFLMVHGGVPFVRRAKHSGVRISGEIYSISESRPG